MTCDDAHRLLAAYHDGELDAVRAVEVEEHLRACDACTAAHENLRTLNSMAQSAYFPAPVDLRENILAATRESDPVRRVAPAPRVLRPWIVSGLALAAAVVLGFFLAQTFYLPSAKQALLAQLTDSHIRSLIGTHLTDVASSDQHTVRPWFEGKLDFAPPAEDLSVQGFPLVGGRVEYIGGRAVAALVYERRKHFINLFVWPEGGAGDVTAEQPQRGYNVLHWTRSGMTCWALSEISENELRNFALEFSNLGVREGVTR